MSHPHMLILASMNDFYINRYYCSMCLWWSSVSTVACTFDWNSPVRKSGLFSHLLFSCLFVSLWAHGYLIYSVGYYSLLFVFILFRCPRFGHCKFPQLGCCILSTIPPLFLSTCFWHKML